VCELSSSSLQQLSLADCPQLHTLCLLCPALQCLNLEECKLLQQVPTLAATIAAAAWLAVSSM